MTYDIRLQALRLKELRRVEHLRQPLLARQVTLPNKLFQACERGDMQLPPDSAKRLQELYGGTVDYWLGSSAAAGYSVVTLRDDPKLPPEVELGREMAQVEAQVREVERQLATMDETMQQALRNLKSQIIKGHGE